MEKLISGITAPLIGGLIIILFLVVWFSDEFVLKLKTKEAKELEAIWSKIFIVSLIVWMILYLTK